MSNEQLQIDIGFVSTRGPRDDNQDFVAALVPRGNQLALQGVTAVVADGVGGYAAGRDAAEIAVRAFIDGYYGSNETLGVERAAARVLMSINRWIYHQGRRDPERLSMATTLSAIIIRGQHAHVFHVGDSRIYLLREQQLKRLTQDHTLKAPDVSHVLYRAIGIEDQLRIDYSQQQLNLHDRLLLCSDGVHGVVTDKKIESLLQQRSSPQQTAQFLVDAALEANSQDNITVMVVDIVGLPPVDRSQIEQVVDALAIKDLPTLNSMVDGFFVARLLSDGRYSRLYLAEDTYADRRPVVLKFPKQNVASDATYRRAFLREMWISSRINSPFLSAVIPLEEGRQTRLYLAMPFYDGETLEQRLKNGHVIGFNEGIDMAMKLSKAVYALNRRRIVHRDIKPENVLLEKGGGVRLLDMGVAWLPGFSDVLDEGIPGTPSYMAPEMYQGHRGDERSDVFALGVTLYRMFSGGKYPYGEVEPFSTPRFNKYTPLAHHRNDLPSWLDAVISAATRPQYSERLSDAMELLHRIEDGLARANVLSIKKTAFYERNPLLFWKTLSALLIAALLISLMW